MIDYTLPFEAYLKLNAVSSSDLKKMLISPAEYHYCKNIKEEPSQAMKLGTAIHTALLEPLRFEKDYAIETEKIDDKRSSAGRKKWEAFKKENEGKEIISFEEGVRIRLLQQQVKKHDLLQEILTSGTPEVSATCERYGLALKARTDFLTLDDCMWDVKTTSDSISPSYPDLSVSRIIAKWRYYFQAAFHAGVFEDNGVKLKSYGWIFISTSSLVPYIYMVKASESLLQYGKDEVNRCLLLLKDCIKNNQWPSVEQREISEISPSAEYLEKF